MPFEPEQVEDHVDDGHLAHQPPHRPLVADVHASLEELEARALAVERHDLTVEHCRGRPEGRAEPAQLRVARGDVAAASALEPRPPPIDVRDRSDAVPLHLERVVLLVGRELVRERRQHRLDVLRHRLAIGILGWIHAVDHPVVAVGLEQRVPTSGTFAVQRDDDLVVAHLVRVVGAAVPDAHRPAAVFASGDVALELEVLEGMILGVHREMVPLRVGRDPARDGPRQEDPVVLQPKVPVHAARVMLLHHEPSAGLAVLRRTGGLRRRLEVPLRPVPVETLAHPTMVARCDRASRRGPSTGGPPAGGVSPGSRCRPRRVRSRHRP